MNKHAEARVEIMQLLAYTPGHAASGVICAHVMTSLELVNSLDPIELLGLTRLVGDHG